MNFQTLYVYNPFGTLSTTCNYPLDDKGLLPEVRAVTIPDAKPESGYESIECSLHYHAVVVGHQQILGGNPPCMEHSGVLWSGLII